MGSRARSGGLCWHGLFLSACVWGVGGGGGGEKMRLAQVCVYVCVWRGSPLSCVFVLLSVHTEGFSVCSGVVWVL